MPLGLTIEDKAEYSIKAASFSLHHQWHSLTYSHNIETRYQFIAISRTEKSNKID